MKDLKDFRRSWSNDHKLLRNFLRKNTSLPEARQLFIGLHDVLHRKSMSGTSDWTYADEIFADLEMDEFRVIPEKGEHSLIWIVWHIARIEDITMNILVEDKNQVYIEGGWRDSLDPPIHYTGNQISHEDLISLTNTVDPKVLLDYRDAVGRRTQDIVKGLSKDRLGENVTQQGLDRIVKEGAVLPESVELLAYWGKKRIYQLLLMPPTRHLMVHLNEAYQLRKMIEP